MAEPSKSVGDGTWAKAMRNPAPAKSIRCQSTALLKMKALNCFVRQTTFESNLELPAESDMDRPDSRLGPTRCLSTRSTPEPGAFSMIAEFLATSERTALRAWHKFFDKDRNGSINYEAFYSSMMNLDFQGDIRKLWLELDDNKSDELNFEEIHEQEAELWNGFRVWCGQTFDSVRDMLVRLMDPTGHGHARLQENSELRPTSEMFVHGLRALGWQGSWEHFLFEVIDLSDTGWFSAEELRWLDIEISRRKRKEAAKKRCAAGLARKALERLGARKALREFRAFLTKASGCLFRGWRRNLDHDGSMALQRAELFKACRELNWHGDVRMLWLALDSDNSGITTLEEFDPRTAHTLAQFKNWAETRWGPKCSAVTFRQLDRNRSQKLKYADFVRGCKDLGFTGKSKIIAMWLDWEDKKYLVVDDLRCLDVWRPPGWLFASPNPEAAEEFRQALKAKYRHFIKGFRAVMDRDSTNACSWYEFEQAAKAIGFTGDVGGAWLDLDKDLSGLIQIREISETAHQTMANFKKWCEDEFGCVRNAFKIFDKDGSGELSYVEFRKACRNYGLQGDIKRLFSCLDQDNMNILHLYEVVFLDEWLLSLEDDDGSGRCEDSSFLPGASQSNTSGECGSDNPQLLEYSSICPGPGHYAAPAPNFGSLRSIGVKRAGAFSFTSRGSWGGPWAMKRSTSTSVGPTTYNLEPSMRATVPSKAAWSFGTSDGRGLQRSTGSSRVRGSASASSSLTFPAVRRDNGSTSTFRDATLADLASAGVASGHLLDSGPGPGSYESKPVLCQGPHFSMSPRRGLQLHPSQKVVPDPQRSAAYASPLVSQVCPAVSLVMHRRK